MHMPNANRVGLLPRSSYSLQLIQFSKPSPSTFNDTKVGESVHPPSLSASAIKPYSNLSAKNTGEESIGK